MKVRTSVQISFHFVGESFDGNAELRRQKFNEVVGRLAKTESSTPTQDEINKIKDLVDHGSAPARYLYGQWQMEGIGVPRDAASGFVQVRRAAEMRYPPAMFDVAQAQLQGDGMPKDEN